MMRRGKVFEGKRSDPAALKEGHTKQDGAILLNTMDSRGKGKR